MRSDWHRYNLKRRVATLPPISSEIFTEKVLQARATNDAAAERAGFQKECGVCTKVYFSENAYQNHLGSQKHKAKVASLLRKGKGGVTADDASSMISSTFSLGDPVQSNTSEVDSDAEEFGHIVQGMKNTVISEKERPSTVNDTEEAPVSEASTEQRATTPTLSNANGATTTLSLNSCLFCNLGSPDLPTNVSHMEKSHGMFIPEKQYLVKLEGLLASLQQRIQEFNECLFCGKVKSNAFAVQTHMRDTAHCRIPYTTEDEQLEIGEFYDFRSTYSDDDDMEDDSDDEDDDASTQDGGAKLGGKRTAVATDEDGEDIEDGGDEGWETDSSTSSLDSADLTDVPAGRHRRHGDDKSSHPHRPARAAYIDDFELHLPSGRSVGHRSLNKYFRQNLRERPFLEGHQQRLALENGDDSDGMDVDGEDDSDNQQVIHRPLRDQKRQLVGRAGGSSGMVGVSDRKKKEVQKAEIKARKFENFRHKRNQWLINKEGNNQKYFHYSIL
ncbi:pre-60S factor rei1 [Cytospora paraplurivora]|uniref:Pre-60S factor rei1 n=1 Tax=Cytospora paraplurivora TaxID=2898453 RepID=A0AAN9YLN5_9PEZI